MDLLEPGTLLARRYRLERLLGEGGMAQVWGAVQEDTGTPVALKLLKADGPADRQRFLREARAVRALAHPAVVRVLDVIEEPQPFIVMERLEGEALDARLARTGPLPVPVLARLLLPVLDALEAAHGRGVVHRDLKPANLFLARGPDGAEALRVLDFGVARLTAAAGELAHTRTLTQSGMAVGTPQYMAPEQAFDDDDADARADLWALGVVLYEALCGRRPFDGERVGGILRAVTSGEYVAPERAAPALPQDVAALIRGLLRVDRARRPGLAQVREVLARHAALTPGASTVPVPQLPPRRDRWLLAAVALGVVAAALAGVSALRRGPPLEGTRVVWVDDKPENNGEEAAALRALGVQLLEVRSTEEAVAALGRAPVDLVVSDISRVEYPGGTRTPVPFAGYALLDLLARRGPVPPFGFYTSNADIVDPPYRRRAVFVADSPEGFVREVERTLRERRGLR